MDKGKKDSKILSLGAILASTIIPLKLIIQEWKYIYSSDIFGELYKLFPIVFTLSIILCLIFIFIIYIILDLRCNDSLIKNYNKSCDLRDKVFHLLNVTIMFYIITVIIDAILYNFVFGYDNLSESIMGKIIFVLYGILFVTFIIFSIWVIKKKNIYFMKIICNIKSRRVRLPREWYIILFMLIFSIFILTFIIIFSSPDTFKYKVKSVFGRDGSIELLISSNVEIGEVKLSVNENKLGFYELSGNIEEVNGTTERLKLIEERHFYKITSSLSEISKKNGNNAIGIIIKTIDNQVNKNNNVLTINNGFYLDENGKYIYTKNVIELGN